MKKSLIAIVLLAGLFTGMVVSSAAKVTADPDSKKIATAPIKAVVKAPAAPGNLAAADDKTRMTLFWRNNAGNDIRFLLERKVGEDGAYQEIKDLGPDAASFADTGIRPGITYYYRLRAYATSGGVRHYSGYSNEVAVMTPKLDADRTPKIPQVLTPANPDPRKQDLEGQAALHTFQPVTLTAPQLAVTGPAPFQPVTLTAPPLTVTGPAPFQPVTVTTPQLTLTGPEH